MGRNQDEASIAQPLPTEAQVIEFLRRHPDFLIRRPELLLSLSPPSRWPDAGGVVDMQIFMIDRFKDEIARIKGAAEHLIHTSRSNMSTQNRTHEAVVSLIGADSMTALVHVVAEDLPPLLDVDVATLCFEECDEPLPELAVPGLSRIPAGQVTKVLGGNDKDCALYEEMPADPMLFGDGTGLAVSSAVVRLAPEGGFPPGVLALGSRHSRTFHSGQGTELLTFLARVINGCIRRFKL